MPNLTLYEILTNIYFRPNHGPNPKSVVTGELPLVVVVHLPFTHLVRTVFEVDDGLTLLPKMLPMESGRFDILS